MKRTRKKGSNSRIVIACRVLAPEMEWLRSNLKNTSPVHYVDQGLHMTPKKMPGIIQEHIDQSQDAKEIVLGYGLCSQGTVGLTASVPIIIPRVHDCISLFLGSIKRYARLVKERPGTFYLTPGWIKERRDPLGMMEEVYVPRMGKKTAEWGMTEELKHYTHIVFINTGIENPEALRKRAKENAAFFGKNYEEIQGDLIYFYNMLTGNYPDEEFAIVKPGKPVNMKLFFS